MYQRSKVSSGNSNLNSERPLLAWPARASRMLESVWKAGLQPRPPLRASHIVQAAIDRQGDHPADGPWRDRLDWLCTALREEADLNALGEAIAYGQLVRIVAGRIRAERLWRANPEISDGPKGGRDVGKRGQARPGCHRMWHAISFATPAR